MEGRRHDVRITALYFRIGVRAEWHGGDVDDQKQTTGKHHGKTESTGGAARRNQPST